MTTKTAKSPAKKRAKKVPKTPGYQPAAELRAMAEDRERVADEVEETLLWFPAALPTDRICVLRQDDRMKKWMTVGYFSPEEATDERCFEVFGGGTFWGRLVRRNTMGREQVLDSVRPTIPGDVKQLRAMYGAATTPGDNAAAAASPMLTRVPDGVDVKEFLQQVIMAKGLDALESKAIAAAAVPVQSSFDRLMDVMAPALPGIIEAWLKRTSPEVVAMASAMQALNAKVDSVMSRPVAPVTPMSETIAGIKSLMEVKDMIANPGGDEPKEGTDMWGIVSKALDVFKSQGPGAPLAGEAAVVGRIAPAPVTPWQVILQEHQARLVDAAQKGMDPSFVAEMVTQFIPPHQRGALMELVQQPNAAALVTQVIPPMQHYAVWLANFVTELREQFFGPVEATDADVVPVDEQEQ